MSDLFKRNEKKLKIKKYFSRVEQIFFWLDCSVVKRLALFILHSRFQSDSYQFSFLTMLENFNYLLSNKLFRLF